MDEVIYQTLNVWLSQKDGQASWLTKYSELQA